MPRVLSPHLSDEMRSAVEAAYAVGHIRRAVLLPGGEWNEVYRIECESGVFALRVSNPETLPESVAYEHELMTFLSDAVPEVPRPVVSYTGRTFISDRGRILSLFPFMPGHITDTPGEALRASAAEVLARLHRAAFTYHRGDARQGHPPIRCFDWTANRDWRWPDIEAFLRGLPDRLYAFPASQHGPVLELAAAVRRLDQLRMEASAWLAGLLASGRPLQFAPIHGDYWTGNLLTLGDRVTAVIDWDNCRPDWLPYELAAAIAGICLDETSAVVDTAGAAAFAAAYRAAGGPVRERDDDLLVPMLRCRTLHDLLFDLGEAVHGYLFDPRYSCQMLRFLEVLSAAKLR